MQKGRAGVLAAALAMCAGLVRADAPTAEVIHWWTSGGESAAVRQLAGAWQQAGGVWVDSAIAGGDQARSVALNRMLGGKAPTAAQFNISKQFLDLVEQHMLLPLDDVARQQDWDHTLPEPVIGAIKYEGHYYALPLDVHMQTWIWYSKAALAKAGVKKEPATVDEFFAALDKLKAAGLVPLAHGGQAWQDLILFMGVLANVGGKQLYLQALRDRDPQAIKSDAFRKVLLAYKRLQSYVDPGAPGRNWNDATAMLISGKAGFQIMGDWAKGEFLVAHQEPGKEFGCMAGFTPDTPYLIQGDAFIFPATGKPAIERVQRQLAATLAQPVTQIAFNKFKGAVPPLSNADVSQLDACSRAGAAIMRQRERQVAAPELYLTPDVNGALQDVVTAYWNTSMPVERAQRQIAGALKR